jgi:hypothetical protein
MPQPSESTARLLARGLLLGVVAWLAWQAFGVLGAYREYRGVARQLPDLPPVRGVPHRRAAEFPVKVWLHRVNSV